METPAAPGAAYGITTAPVFGGDGRRDRTSITTPAPAAAAPTPSITVEISALVSAPSITSRPALVHRLFGQRVGSLRAFEASESVRAPNAAPTPRATTPTPPTAKPAMRSGFGCEPVSSAGASAPRA